MAQFKVENLPDVDQREIKRGLCPWCLVRLYSGDEAVGDGDHCPDCGCEFIGKLTIED